MVSVSSISGGVVLVVCAFFYGLEKSRVETKKLEMTESMCAFVEYIGQQIETFRTPLQRIFEEFSDERLEKEGFLNILRERGLSASLTQIKEKLPREAFCEMERFSNSLGAGYEKGQAELCSYTVKRLEKTAFEGRERLAQRLRMYRLLPVLLALSLVILLL